MTLAAEFSQAVEEDAGVEEVEEPPSPWRQKNTALTQDHKPSEEAERVRPTSSRR